MKPIELQVSIQRNVEHSGWLSKDKGETILSAVQQFLTNPDRRFFILRGFFLAYFKTDKVRSRRRSLHGIFFDKKIKKFNMFLI